MHPLILVEMKNKFCFWRKICLGRIPATYFGKESHKQIVVEYCGQNEKKGIEFYDIKDRQGKILN